MHLGEFRDMLTLIRKPGLQTSFLQDESSVPYIKFHNIEQTGIVKHGFSTRLGGVSKGMFSSMNLSFTRGDDEIDVRENFERIASAIGFDYKDIVFTDQTHTNNIKIVVEADKGKGMIKSRDYDNIDGLITNIPNLPLAAFFADCVPLYFVDKVNYVIGLSHSGWKGTVKKIGSETVKAMEKTFGSKPENIVACIAPSICKNCYEVSEDVAIEFINQFDAQQIKNILKKKENGKYQLDLWKANEFILLGAGILKENISMPDLCTCCNKEVLFSHRGLMGKRGNLGAFLMLK